jgi:hypothetical protein
VTPTQRALATIGGGLRELVALRWARVVLVVLAVALVLRAGLEIALARAVNQLVSERGLACGWDDLDVSLLTGRGEVHSFTLGSTEGGEAALLEVEYGVFDLELLPLFAGRLYVRRAEVDGLDAHLERGADGRWNFERYLAIEEVLALMESGGAEPDDETADDPARPIELKPPLAIGALRAQSSRLHLVDRTVTPPLELTFETDVGLSHLSTSERPARFSATVTGNHVLDGAHLDGELKWIEDGLQLTTFAQVGGLRPAVLQPLLDPLDIRVACDSLHGRLRSEIELRVVGEERDSLRIRMALTDVLFAADTVESLALDALTVEVDSASSSGAAISSVHVAGIRGRASLRESGAIRVAGIDLLPAAEAQARSHWMDSLVSALELWTSEATPRWASLLVRRDPDAYPWTLGALSVSDGAFRLADHTVDPPAEFPLLIDGIEVGRIQHDPAREAPAIPVSVAMRSPGMADVIEVHGEIGPMAPVRTLDLTIAMTGIGLEAMAGHLERAGLQRDLKKGNLHLRLAGRAQTDDDGRTEGWLELDEVGLQEGRELFGVRSVKARGLLLDPEARLMRMGEVEVSGPRLSFARDPSNELVAFGLRTLGLAPTAEMTAKRPKATDPAGESAEGVDDEPEVPIRIEVGRFAWTDSDVVFVDEASDPPQRIEFDELGFELEGLTLGGDPDGPTPDPARFTGRAVAPGVFDEMSLTGTVRSQPGGIDVTGELELRGHGLNGRLIAPYMRLFGVEPALGDGQLSVDVVASLAERDGWRASLKLNDVTLTDDGETIWSMGELRIDEVVLAETLSVAGIGIDEPYLRLAREPDGALVIGGLRVLTRPDDASEVQREFPALTFPTLPAVQLGELRIANGRVSWADHTFTPPLTSELKTESFSLEDLATDGRQAEFGAVLRVGDTIEQIDLNGTVRLGPDSLHATAEVGASGIRAGPLARMLPPGVLIESQDGRFDGSFEASLASSAAGGLAASVGGANLQWHEGEAAPTAAIDGFQLSLPRLDPAAGVIEVGAAQLEGVDVTVRRDASGVLHAGGLRVDPAELAPAPAADDETAPSGVLPLPERIALVEGARLDVDRFTIVDEALGADARPFEASLSARLDPCVLIDAVPADLPPISWHLGGGVRGLIESWRLEGRTTPFAAEPKASAEWELTGVRTAGLVELVPALAQYLNGTVENGHVAGSLEGTLFVRRARPTELGLARPFGAELTLSNVAYRRAPDGEVLAGVERVHAELERVDLAESFVHVKLIEVQRPQGVARRNGMSLRALGLELSLEELLAESSAEEAEAATVEDADTSESATAGEVRIDELLVTDLDVHLWDETGQPPLHIAPSSLDAEVKRLTTKALSEKRPIQFSALLEGAEREPTFDEVALSGRVSLFPEPAGWVSVSLGGLELPRFSGVAAEQGIELKDGALDAGVRVRLKGADGAKVRASLVFSDLALSELEGGPIESALGLSMPVESALFLLRNADGEHRFSTGITLDSGGLTMRRLMAAGTQAFAGVVGGALAGMPLRLLGAMIPGGDEEAEPARETFALAFAPAATELDARALAGLAEARRRMEAHGDLFAVVRHELTAADLGRAERLANPSGAECLELAQRLRQRKSELLRHRSALGTEARTLYAVGAEDSRAASERLLALEEELFTVENGLDRVFQILRSDSPRQRAKRTRSACREIADLRLEAAEAFLRPGLTASEQDRLEVRSARFTPLEREGGGAVVIELRKR